jgi:hypothetical protein
MNKELLEVAEKEYPKLIVENPSCNGYNEPNHIDINEECRNAFMEGAKYVQEQMYSEEDLHIAYCAGNGYDIDCLESNQQYYMFKEWFENFKNK